MMQIEVAPQSLSFVHDKVNGTDFSVSALKVIIHDIHHGRYTAAQIATFITACAARPLSHPEIYALTRAMTQVGACLEWSQIPIVDKHCIGGLPGNRTTPIIVAVMSALGHIVPKTSSRAITSAAGTADVMEVIASVHFSVKEMQDILKVASGCVIWGGAVGLSPVDDDIIRVAREIELDGEGQLVASILSKKLAAGSTHIVIDIPVGPTAKIETHEDAVKLKNTMTDIADHFELKTAIEITDGRQPIGFGIGPALEARDVLAVLQNEDTAPSDLRDKSMCLSGRLLELVGVAKTAEGTSMAYDCLSSGKAWEAFQLICKAQGGLKTVPKAQFTKTVKAPISGTLQSMDNRLLTRIAKLAGAPEDKTAGIDLFVKLGDFITKGQALFTIHSNSSAQIETALFNTKLFNPLHILKEPLKRNYRHE